MVDKTQVHCGWTTPTSSDVVSLHHCHWWSTYKSTCKPQSPLLIPHESPNYPTYRIFQPCFKNFLLLKSLIFLGSALWIGWWKLPGLAVWHFGSLAVSSPAPWSGTRMCQYSWEVCQYSWKVWQYSWQGDFSLHFKWHMLSKKLWFPLRARDLMRSKLQTAPQQRLMKGYVAHTMCSWREAINRKRTFTFGPLP